MKLGPRNSDGAHMAIIELVKGALANTYPELKRGRNNMQTKKNIQNNLDNIFLHLKNKKILVENYNFSAPMLIREEKKNHFSCFLKD